MKKKFLISGVAVFLVVLLCSSALFAFADYNGPFYPISVVYLNDWEVTAISDFDLSPTFTINPSDGGSYKDYNHPANSFFLFQSGCTLFYHYDSPRSFYGINSLPVVGETLSPVSVSVEGTYVKELNSSLSMYRFVLPTDYSYYLVPSFGLYTPPATLWGRVTAAIDGLIASFGAFINGCMSNPVLAVCVIVIPVFTLIVTILLSVIPHRGKVRSGKRSYRRRR